MVDELGNITVYGAPWCPDCKRAKKFLTERRIRYRWVDIDEDVEARALVEAKNNGKRIIPTIVFEDGSFLVEPSNMELARKLGLQTRAQRQVYDLIIIGGGPCGLTAAIYAAREGMDTLVIERSGLGGQAGLTVALDNFPGFPDGVSGTEFTERLVQQARRFNVEILQAQEVLSIQPEVDGCRCVILPDKLRLESLALLIATGASYRRLGIPGEEEYLGAGVHYCATCDGPFYKGADSVTVIGGGNSAVEEGLHLLNFAHHVHMLVRGPQLKASKTAIDSILSNPNVTIHYNTQVTAIAGKQGKLTHIGYINGNGQRTDLPTSAAFVFIGQQPNTQFLNNTLRTDERGFILTGHDLVHGVENVARIPFNMETSTPGIFAAGDCRSGSTKQVASAVGEGASAAIAIRDYLKTV